LPPKYGHSGNQSGIITADTNLFGLWKYVDSQSFVTFLNSIIIQTTRHGKESYYKFSKVLISHIEGRYQSTNGNKYKAKSSSFNISCF
jgi:hypothetical protein